LGKTHSDWLTRKEEVDQRKKKKKKKNLGRVGYCFTWHV
jgi:hypothetical protein